VYRNEELENRSNGVKRIANIVLIADAPRIRF
jgi:hypothetical protein